MHDTCVLCRVSQYVEVIGHLHENRTVQEFKTTDFGDSFGELFIEDLDTIKQEQNVTQQAKTCQNRRLGWHNG